MPRLAPGLATRTRRPRPSERNALRVFSGFSPQGLSLGPGPLEGRAPHARKGRDRANPYVASFSPPTFRAPVRNHDMPSLASSLASRMRRPRPSEKIAFRVISGFSPVGPPTLRLAPLGGAGSARPRGRLGLHRGMSPLGNRPLANSSTMMTCLGLRTASQCGRAERVPSRKSPFASSPGVSPRGHPSRPPSPHPPSKLPEMLLTLIQWNHILRPWPPATISLAPHLLGRRRRYNPTTTLLYTTPSLNQRHKLPNQ